MIPFIMFVCILGAPIAIIALLTVAVTIPLSPSVALAVVAVIVLLTIHWVRVCR